MNAFLASWPCARGRRLRHCRTPRETVMTRRAGAHRPRAPSYHRCPPCRERSPPWRARRSGACPSCPCPSHPSEIAWRQDNHGRCAALGCHRLGRLPHIIHEVDEPHFPATFVAVTALGGAVWNRTQVAGGTRRRTYPHCSLCARGACILAAAAAAAATTATAGGGVYIHVSEGAAAERGFVLMWRREWVGNRAVSALSKGGPPYCSRSFCCDKPILAALYGVAALFVLPCSGPTAAAPLSV